MVILSIVGLLGNLIDFIICTLVPDPNTVTARHVSQFLDVVLVLMYLTTTILICCGPKLNTLWGKLGVYLVLGVVAELFTIATYGLFTGIWNQGHQEYMDFYKEVALVILLYMGFKFVYTIMFLCMMASYVSQDTEKEHDGFIRIKRNQEPESVEMKVESADAE